MCRSETSVLTQTRDTQSFSGLSSTSSSRSSPQCAISITKKEQWRLLEQRRVLVKKVADANHAVDNGEFTFRQQGFPPPAAQAGVPILVTSYSGGPGRHTDESTNPVRFCALRVLYSWTQLFLEVIDIQFVYACSVQAVPSRVDGGAKIPVQFRGFLNEFFTEYVCRLRRFPSRFSEELLKDLVKLHFKVLGIFLVFVQESSKFTRLFREGFLSEFFPEVRFWISKSSDFSQFSRDGRVGYRCHLSFRKSLRQVVQTWHTRHTRHDTHDTLTTHFRHAHGMTRHDTTHTDTTHTTHRHETTRRDATHDTHIQTTHTTHTTHDTRHTRHTTHTTHTRDTWHAHTHARHTLHTHMTRTTHTTNTAHT